jgi:hypothetical protein
MFWTSNSAAKQERDRLNWQPRFAFFPTVVAIDVDSGKHIWVWFERYESRVRDFGQSYKFERRLPGRPEYRQYEIKINKPLPGIGSGY